MAKSNNNNNDNPFFNLSGDTMVEVAFVKGERVIVTTMTFRGAYYTKPKKGWKKWTYQLGQCAFTPTENLSEIK